MLSQPIPGRVILRDDEGLRKHAGGDGHAFAALRGAAVRHGILGRESMAPAALLMALAPKATRIFC
jgi:hypothetical protein